MGKQKGMREEQKDGGRKANMLTAMKSTDTFLQALDQKSKVWKLPQSPFFLEKPLVYYNYILYYIL